MNYDLKMRHSEHQNWCCVSPTLVLKLNPGLTLGGSRAEKHQEAVIGNLGLYCPHICFALAEVVLKDLVYEKKILDYNSRKEFRLLFEPRFWTAFQRESVPKRSAFLQGYICYLTKDISHDVNSYILQISTHRSKYTQGIFWIIIKVQGEPIQMQRIHTVLFLQTTNQIFVLDNPSVKDRHFSEVCILTISSWQSGVLSSQGLVWWVCRDMRRQGKLFSVSWYEDGKRGRGQGKEEQMKGITHHVSTSLYPYL